MNPYNPYEAPHANESPAAGPNADAQAMILEAMKRTRPWVLFLSILGFLGSGVMFLLGLFMLVAGSAMTALAKGPMDKFTPLLGLVYIGFGAFQIAPSLLLFRYGSAIGDHSASGGAMPTLVTAVERQASFWRFAGIATAVIMGLYFVIIFVAVGVGVAAGLSR